MKVLLFIALTYSVGLPFAVLLFAGYFIVKAAWRFATTI